IKWLFRSFDDGWAYEVLALFRNLFLEPHQRSLILLLHHQDGGRAKLRYNLQCTHHVKPRILWVVPQRNSLTAQIMPIVPATLRLVTAYWFWDTFGVPTSS